MGEKLIIGPINKGLRTDREPFVIDNDSFPTLINAYQWRGRVKRKRGTSLLNRLQRFFNSTVVTYNTGSTTITLDGGGNGNIITGFSLNGLSPNANVVPGSVILVASGGPTTFTDPTKDGFLTPTGTGGANTINYATGAILIPSQAGNTVTATFSYFPTLPVMGLEDLILTATQFPGTLAFDTKFSYNVLTASPYTIYDVSFYKNPTTDPTNLPGYIAKANWTPLNWNGQDYQQFYTTNYQGALWATNGINVPFSTANIGMQFKNITGMNITSAIGPNGPSIVTLTILGHGLVQGDFIFVNEVVYTAPNTANSINFQTGYVINVIDANNVSVEFPNAFLTGTYSSGGIAQYLTSNSDSTKDCLRWYDGDPTNGFAANPTFVLGNGWVNFAPPLSQANFSIADETPRQYYLVGARMIVPFKDRLLFLGPVIQTSKSGSATYLQDTIIYSQNGTPYYTCSFTGDPSLSTTTFFPILTPTINANTTPIIYQTATANAYWEDQTGFGGFISAGISQPMLTVSSNEDVLIIGFNALQTRLVYTGNDIVPFNLFVINSELGSGSTFSTINMDQGVITRGTRGYIITNQTSAQRIDLEIPDQVFEINLTNNGNERICAQRDFINEWIYFTYPTNATSSEIYRFPNQTLLYNYRDNSWAIMNETYTTYGAFRRQTGFIWSTVGLVFPTWSGWNEPWDAGNSTLLQQEVIAGNQEGFVMVKDEGTGEGTSLIIKSFSGNTLTVPNHCLNNGDYIIISGCLGSIGTQVNGKIFSIIQATTNTFQLDPLITSGTYSGAGLITRLYVPFIQTKQFPTAWGISKKTRLGPQQYLLTTTANAQIQLLIFLSQNSSSPYNLEPIVPSLLSTNDSLIYSTTLYTCPESTNLGLIPLSANMANQANTNLQMIVEPQTGTTQQKQLWHRINTSLIGDTVQMGFTISDAQMRELDPEGSGFAITGATQANPCVLTCTGQFETGQLITISGVVGMTQLNGNIFSVVSSTSTNVTINVDSTGFTPYISGGLATPVANPNHFAEIELHGIILDVSPSMVLA